MTTSVIQQKGLPNDYFVHRKGDSLVSQKWGETPWSHNPEKQLFHLCRQMAERLRLRRKARDAISKGYVDGRLATALQTLAAVLPGPSL